MNQVFALNYFSSNPEIQTFPVHSIGLNPEWMWPACKTQMADVAMPSAPASFMIYAQKQDIAEASEWFYTYIRRNLLGMLSTIEDQKVILGHALAALPKPAPVESEMMTLWIVPELVAAIVNCDFTGVSDEDEKLIHRFMEKYNHIMLTEMSQSKWCKCEVTKLDSVCIPVYFDPKMSAKIKELAA